MKTVTLQRQGLRTATSNIDPGSVGSLAVAQNVVINHQGLWESRLGMNPTASFPISGGLDYLDNYSSRLVLHDSSGSMFLYDPITGASSSVFDNVGTGFLTNPAGRFVTAESNGNLYVSVKNGVRRLDGFTTGTGSIATALPAGAPPGLDVSASLSRGSGSDGTAVPGFQDGQSLGSQVAYRFLFGIRDANNNLTLGAPSGRGLAISPAVTVAVGNISASSNLWTVTASLHPFVGGENVVVDNGEANYPAGTYPVATVIDANHFTLTVTGATAKPVSTIPHGMALSARNVTVASTIPPGLTTVPQGYTSNPYFYQIYRSAASVGAAVSPDDELGLVYEAPVPVAVSATSIARSSGTVTLTLASPHGLLSGEIVFVTSLAPVLATGNIVGIGLDGHSAVSSDSGHTWVTHSAPAAANIFDLCWNGVQIVGVGADASGTGTVATSPDGITWTSQSWGTGTLNQVYWQGVAWNGNFYVAVGTDLGAASLPFPAVAATSPDGITWTARGQIADANKFVISTIGSTIVWNGLLFIVSGVDPNTGTGVIATSPDGVNWTIINLNPSSDSDVFSLAFNGSVVIGSNNSQGICNRSINGSIWNDIPYADPGYFADTYAISGTTFIAAGKVFDVNFHFVSSSVETSPDGIIWTQQTYPPFLRTAFYATYNGNQIIVLGVSGTSSIIVSSSNGAAWSTGSYPFSPSNLGPLVSTTPNSLIAGRFTITSVPTTQSITFTLSGSDFTNTPTNGLVTPLAVGVVDTVPDGFRQDPLYTNPSQQGIIQSNAVPPDCTDMARFRDTMFFADPLQPASIPVSLLGVSSSLPGVTGTQTGLQLGDIVLMGGGQLLAGTAELPLAQQFLLSTSSLSPSLNIQLTVDSLVRVVNQNTLGLGVYAVETSVQNGLPGLFSIISNNAQSTATISFPSRSGSEAVAWSVAGGTSVPPRRRLGVLAYSKLQQPDAVPVLNTVPVGSSNQAIRRLVALRDSLIVLKDDGVFRVTGDPANGISVQPIDLTVRIIAPETARALNNYVYCLSTKGFVRIADLNSTDPISLDIDDKVQFLGTPKMIQTTFDVAHAVADENKRQYIAWVPSSPTSSFPDLAWTYSWNNDAWTGPRTDMYAHAVVANADNRLWAVSGSNLVAERHNGDYTDYADALVTATATLTGASLFSGTATYFIDAQAQVGDAVVQTVASDLLAFGLPHTYIEPVVWGNVVSASATPSGTNVQIDHTSTFAIGTGTVSLYRAIPVQLGWNPSYGTDPGARHHWSEAQVIFRDAQFARLSMSFTTDLSPSAQSNGVLGSDIQMPANTTSFPNERVVRFWLPLEKQRASRLFATMIHADAWRPFQVQALGMVFNPGDEKISR